MVQVGVVNLSEKFNFWCIRKEYLYVKHTLLIFFYYILIYMFLAFNFSSDSKGFTFVKFTSQLFSSANESLKDEACLLLLWDGLLVTLHTLCCVYLYNICGEVSAHLYGDEKLFNGWALFQSFFAFWLCCDIYIYM